MFWKRSEDPEIIRRVSDLEAEVKALKRIVDELDETYARRFKKLTARNGASEEVPAVREQVNGHSRWWLRRHGHGVPADVPSDGGR